jgi:hemerythrin
MDGEVQTNRETTMLEIKWGPDLMIGVPEIDRQHEELVRLLNELFNAYMEDETGDVIADSVNAVADYADYHFSAEEELMEKVGYPGMAEHSQIHVSFTEKSLEFLVDFLEGREALPTEIIEYLGDWVVEHIKVTDMALGQYMRESGKAA